MILICNICVEEGAEDPFRAPDDPIAHEFMKAHILEKHNIKIGDLK